MKNTNTNTGNTVDIQTKLTDIRTERAFYWGKIIELYNSLNVPKEYQWTPNCSDAEYYIGISDRSRAKTTNSLLIGICAYKLFGWTSGYFRNTQQDGVKSNMDTLCDVINEYGYIRQLFPEYDRVIYKYMGGYWCLYNDEMKEESEPIMYKFIVDKYVNYLGRNEINCNIIVYDEFMHDLYADDRFIHFMSIHKTIARERTTLYNILISNNTNINHPYLTELGLQQVAKQIRRGESRLIKLSKGTMIRFELFGNFLEEKAQQSRAIVNTLYYGFDNPKMAVITGEGNDWGCDPYDPIIYYPNDRVIDNRIKLKYNSMWYSLTIVYNDTIGTHINIKPYTDKIKNEFICFVDRTPENRNEFYGLRDFRAFTTLYASKKVFYSDYRTAEDIRAFITYVK